MNYSITPTEVVFSIDFSVGDLTLTEFNKVFDAFIQELKTIDYPINNLNVAVMNTGRLNDEEHGEDVFNDLSVINASLNVLSQTLVNLEERFVPHSLEMNFYSFEPIEDDKTSYISFVSGIFDFIGNLPNTSIVKKLSLNLQGLNLPEESSLYFTEDFLQRFPLLTTFTLDANYIEDLSVDQIMIFIAQHNHLKSINIDISVAQAENFDLRQVMLNKNLTSLEYKHTVLYPRSITNDEEISEQFKCEYWEQLGQCIKQHPNLKSFVYDVDTFDCEDSTDVHHAMINNFLHEIAYNRSLERLSVNIIEKDLNLYPSDEEQTEITRQHYIKNSLIADINIRIDGVKLKEKRSLCEPISTGGIFHQKKRDRSSYEGEGEHASLPDMKP